MQQISGEKKVHDNTKLPQQQQKHGLCKTKSQAQMENKCGLVTCTLQDTVQ